MPRSRSGLPAHVQRLVDEVTHEFVHRLFPALRGPALLACPDEITAAACIRAITRAAKKKGTSSELVDLRPAPADRLGQVTARLRDIDNYVPDEQEPRTKLLILDGFDRLEGEGKDAPTYPFRSKFQFDQEHLWLFMGQDWRKLSRLFGSYTLPLYRAASDITPTPWRMTAKASGHKPNSMT